MAALGLPPDAADEAALWRPLPTMREARLRHRYSADFGLTQRRIERQFASTTRGICDPGKDQRW